MRYVFCDKTLYQLVNYVKLGLKIGPWIKDRILLVDLGFKKVKCLQELRKMEDILFQEFKRI
jgi:hypothetical protein